MIEFRSPRVINAIAYLFESGNSFASGLAETMRVDSREVYPILKTWIWKGVVEITKAGRRNVYSLSQKFKSLVKNTVKRYIYKGRDFIIAKAKERYKRFIGLDPDPEVIAVIEYFVDKVLSGNPYVQGSQDGSVAEILSEALGISLFNINEILRDLVQANILYVWRDRKASVAKARLDSSLTA
ncbi:hypothetical protein [Sulfuracidifex tepidarius]|uniref:Uncharacterized protein n=1 Tax=Sulfuracidifex tepidarius TaxID=1294262 RepID=A0A510E5F7_9CREN|nr:hypothetical protein [Sulfuracidifex tepidarius]BBG27290.1 hypothetical protein IC007_1835 [Sulfuracidifex tepidarius]